MAGEKCRLRYIETICVFLIYIYIFIYLYFSVSFIPSDTIIILSLCTFGKSFSPFTLSNIHLDYFLLSYHSMILSHRYIINILCLYTKFQSNALIYIYIYISVSTLVKISNIFLSFFLLCLRYIFPFFSSLACTRE